MGAHYVGYYRPKSIVAQHWDGQSWTTVATPDPGKGQNELSDVSSTGPDDVWAVGYFWNNNGGPEHLLAEHWDGTAWTSVHVQQPEFTGHHHSRCRLTDVVAIAPDDAWALGYTFNGGPQIVTEHWDGSRWSIVTNPDDEVGANALAAAGADDMWAVGHGSWHWDGTGWNRVPVPGLAGSLYDVVAPSSNDAWALGNHLWHWDGDSWAIQRPRHPPTGWGSLSATSASDVWATGEKGDYPKYRAMIYHWDGTTWSAVALPQQLEHSVIRGISADSTDDAWVFGRPLQGDQKSAVVAHWDGTGWHLQK